MNRITSGSYISKDNRYRIERGWADEPGTDRRRQTWVVTRIDNDGYADIVDESRTYAGACRIVADDRRIRSE